MQEEEILNEEEFDQLMPTLIEAFKTVYSGKSTDISYNDTYRAVYRLCKKGMHTKIVDQLVSVSQNHFKDILCNILEEQDIIKCFHQAINRCNDEINRIMEILLYVETNYYHECKKEYESLKDLLNTLLYTQLSSNPEIFKQISKKITQAKIAGQGEIISATIQMINGFGKHEFFQKFFVGVYEPLMTEYYTKRSEENFEKLEQKEYFLASQKLLQEEREWLKKYFLNKKTKNEITRLMSSLYVAVVTNFRERIYKKDPETLFKKNTLWLLELLREKGDNSQIEAHNQWFMEEIKKRLQDLKKCNNSEFLQNFINHYHEVNNSLSDLKQFSIRYKAIFFFEDWINDQKIHLPKRINFYIEECISKKLDPQESLKVFKELFKFLKEKDLFEKLFRNDYVMRLIYNQYDPSFENLAIKEMQNQCGQQWPEKIHKATLAPHYFDQKFNEKMNVLCFEDVIWPLDKGKIIAELPKRLIKLGNQFVHQRSEKLKKVKLQFHPIHGTALVSVKFNSCTQNMKLDTRSLSILLHLEELGNSTTLKKIKNQSHYTAQQLKPAIKQLQQLKIIEVDGDIESPDFTFSLPTNFAGQQKIIDLTTKYTKLLTTFSYTSQQMLQPDRKTMVSALIIKAMKNSKVCSSQNLLENVKPMIETRGFQFNQKFVLNTIKDLIDRDFIKELENGKYEYIPV